MARVYELSLRKFCVDDGETLLDEDEDTFAVVENVVSVELELEEDTSADELEVTEAKEERVDEPELELTPGTDGQVFCTLTNSTDKFSVPSMPKFHTL